MYMYNTNVGVRYLYGVVPMALSICKTYLDFTLYYGVPGLLSTAADGWEIKSDANRNSGKVSTCCSIVSVYDEYAVMFLAE